MNAAAHVNQIAFMELMAERCGGAVERHGGSVCVAMNHPFPFLNAMLVEDDEADPAEAVSHAREFFAARKRREWSVFTRPTGEDDALEGALAKAGLSVVNSSYREMISVGPVMPPHLHPDIKIREVETDDERHAYWQLCADAYASLNFPPKIFKGWEALIEAPVTACLAVRGNRAIGGALFCNLKHVGFIGWVAASPEARGKGVGGAVTAWVTNRSIEQGADFTSLQASPMGLPIYEGLGYETLFDYSVWRYSG
jgi:hypothetical protein